jgi:hypothetical protein
VRPWGLSRSNVPRNSIRADSTGDPRWAGDRSYEGFGRFGACCSGKARIIRSSFRNIDRFLGRPSCSHQPASVAPTDAPCLRDPHTSNAISLSEHSAETRRSEYGPFFRGGGRHWCGFVASSTCLGASSCGADNANPAGRPRRVHYVSRVRGCAILTKDGFGNRSLS